MHLFLQFVKIGRGRGKRKLISISVEDLGINKVSEEPLGETNQGKLEADIAKLNKHVDNKFGKMD